MTIGDLPISFSEAQHDAAAHQEFYDEDWYNEEEHQEFYDEDRYDEEEHQYIDDEFLYYEQDLDDEVLAQLLQQNLYGI